MSISDSDVHQALKDLPALSLLTEEVRRLVAASFEPLSFPFGAVIVREGDPADAFYLLTFGSARVVKQGDNGDEVPLNVLHAGDSFGEIALLKQGARTVTVRARGSVEALRLDGAVFSALTTSHPEVRAMFEAVAKQRELWTFLRVHSSFSELPAEALAELSAGLERTEVPAGNVVIREGDPSGPMYVVEEGRARAFKAAQPDLAYFRKGDFFGDRSLFLGVPRAASVEAVTRCVLLRFPPELFQRLLADHPRFRAALEQRMRQYEYRRLSRVPLDFAEEILPAEASVHEKVSPDQATALSGAAAVEATVYAPKGRRRGRSGSAASRTATSSTRWTAALRP
jgi:ATP-binding cassette subfamily B protein